MIYSLTDKLDFEKNPVLEIKGKKLEVKADAETVLSLMDIVQNKSEIEATREAANILFDEKDLKVLKSFKLGFKDYSKVITTAMNLAVGTDPDAEENSVGEA